MKSVWKLWSLKPIVKRRSFINFHLYLEIFSISNSEICLSIPPYNYSERENFSFFTIVRVLSQSIFENIIIVLLTSLTSSKISFLFFFCLLICLISSIFIPFYFFFYLSSISFSSFLPYFSQMLRWLWQMAVPLYLMNLYAQWPSVRYYCRSSSDWDSSALTWEDLFILFLMYLTVSLFVNLHNVTLVYYVQNVHE